MSSEAARRALVRLMCVLEKDSDPDDAAGRLIEGFVNPERVFETDAEDLIAKAGVSRRAAEMVDFIDELTRRVLTDEYGIRPKLNTAKSAGDYMRALMRGRHVEYCYAACLDKSGRLIQVKLLQRGTIDSANIYIRDVVQVALRTGASGIVLAHNHPGRTLRPSGDDVQVTRAAREALKMADVELIEHVIVTDSGSIGIIEEGYLI